MFFLPTLNPLTNAVTHKHTGISSVNSSSSTVPVPVPPTPTNRLFILCLSNGNYDNLGSVRERELRAAADIISNCDNTGGSDNDNDSGSEHNTTKYHLNNPIKVTTVNDALWTLKSVRNPIIKYVPLMILLQFMWGWILKCSSTSLFMTQNTSTRTWCSKIAETNENCTRTSTGSGISFYMINPSSQSVCLVSKIVCCIQSV